MTPIKSPCSGDLEMVGALLADLASHQLITSSLRERTIIIIDNMNHVDSNNNNISDTMDLLDRRFYRALTFVNMPRTATANWLHKWLTHYFTFPVTVTTIQGTNDAFVALFDDDVSGWEAFVAISRNDMMGPDVVIMPTYNGLPESDNHSNNTSTAIMEKWKKKKKSDFVAITMEESVKTKQVAARNDMTLHKKHTVDILSIVIFITVFIVVFSYPLTC